MSEDRARLARIFEQGLGHVVGYALPLRREYYTDGTSAWVSGAWFLRSEEMFLVPGDSPMGFRLPLDSIPWVSESEYPHLVEQDPMAERPPLPRDGAALSSSDMRLAGRSRETRRDSWSRCWGRAGFRGAAARRRIPPICRRLQGESAPWIIRTALVHGSARRRVASLHAAAALSRGLS